MADKRFFVDAAADLLHEYKDKDAQEALKAVKPFMDDLFYNRSYVPLENAATDGKESVKVAFDRLISVNATKEGQKALRKCYEVGSKQYNVYAAERSKKGTCKNSTPAADFKHICSSLDPVPYMHIVDVLNDCFGELYIGKHLNGWQRGARSVGKNDEYLVWFPKLSSDGVAASNSGWVNIIDDDGCTIEEIAPTGDKVNEYDLTEQKRFVFAKSNGEPYYFRGIFIPEMSRCTKHHRYFKKIFDFADVSVYPPKMWNVAANVDDTFFPESADIAEACFEGAVSQVTVNKYERNPKAREACIKHYNGAFCLVCGFDFEKAYGEIGKDFIHVHHIIPISKIGKEYEVDYERDLIPVCPNCHAMLHRKINGHTLSVAELRELVADRRK